MRRGADAPPPVSASRLRHLPAHRRSESRQRSSRSAPRGSYWRRRSRTTIGSGVRPPDRPCRGRPAGPRAAPGSGNRSNAARTSCVAGSPPGRRHPSLPCLVPCVHRTWLHHLSLSRMSCRTKGASLTQPRWWQHHGLPGHSPLPRYRTLGMASIRVVLAEDNALLREGIARIIDGEPDFDLVGRAADLPQLLALIEDASPQVVVTDIRMPPTG